MLRGHIGSHFVVSVAVALISSILGTCSAWAIALTLGAGTKTFNVDTNFQGGVWDTASAGTLRVEGATMTLDGFIANLFEISGNATHRLNIETNASLVNSGTFRITSPSSTGVSLGRLRRPLRR